MATVLPKVTCCTRTIIDKPTQRRQTLKLSTSPKTATSASTFSPPTLLQYVLPDDQKQVPIFFGSSTIETIRADEKEPSQVNISTDRTNRKNDRALKKAPVPAKGPIKKTPPPLPGHLSRFRVGYSSAVQKGADPKNVFNVAIPKKQVVIPPKPVHPPAEDSRKNSEKPVLVTSKKLLQEYWSLICEEFIVLDCEFTGSKKGKPGRLFEIACLKFAHFRQVGFWHQFFNPEQPLEPFVQSLTGCNSEFLRHQPHFKDKILEFETFIGNNTPLVTHDALPDIQVLQGEFQLAGRDSYIFRQRPIVDTLRLSETLDLGETKRTLDALCDYCQVDRRLRTVHRAEIDAALLAKVFLRMLKKHNHDLGVKHDGSDLSNQ